MQKVGNFFKSGFSKIKGLVIPAVIQIYIAGETQAKKIRSPIQEDIQLPIFQSIEPIKGTVTVAPVEGEKKIDHDGITCEFIASMEINAERSVKNNFLSVIKEFEQKGCITSSKTYNFDFSNVRKEIESYYGSNVKIRYLIQVKIHRTGPLSITQEREYVVRVVQTEPEIKRNLKLEVGVPGQLHIEFEYSKNNYHLQDVIIGKISFLECRLKIKNMEVMILKKETAFLDANAWNDSDSLQKFEVMDGTPVRGEVIPIRLYLQPLNLTPTYPTINSSFQVRYFINIIIYDEDDRRYFKQQEITFWRKDML